MLYFQSDSPIHLPTTTTEWVSSSMKDLLISIYSSNHSQPCKIIYYAILPVYFNSAYYLLLSLSLKFFNSNKPERKSTSPKSVDFIRISLRETCTDISDKTKKKIYFK